MGWAWSVAGRGEGRGESNKLMRQGKLSKGIIKYSAKVTKPSIGNKIISIVILKIA
jgi:hypothetical protein